MPQGHQLKLAQDDALGAREALPPLLLHLPACAHPAAGQIEFGELESVCALKQLWFGTVNNNGQPKAAAIWGADNQWGSGRLGQVEKGSRVESPREQSWHWSWNGQCVIQAVGLGVLDWALPRSDGLGAGLQDSDACIAAQAVDLPSRQD